MEPTARISDLAAIFGMTERAARDLLAASGARPVARGQWPMPDALKAVFRHLRSARQASAVSAARASHLEAQAARTRLSIARAERALIPIDDAILAIDTIAGAARTELEGLPARLARDRQARAAAEAEVRRAMQAIADRLSATAAALRTGDTADIEAGDDD